MWDEVGLPDVDAAGVAGVHHSLAVVLAGVADAVFEDEGVPEDEVGVVEEVHRDGGGGYGEEAGGLGAGAVVVLVPDVEGDGEDAALFPLEGRPAVGVVADEGGASSAEDVDVLLEEVLFGGHFAARGDFGDVGVVGSAVAVEVDVGAEAVEAGPGLDLDGAEVVDGESGDVGDAFAFDERLVGADLGEAGLVGRDFGLGAELRHRAAPLR